MQQAQNIRKRELPCYVKKPSGPIPYSLRCCRSCTACQLKRTQAEGLGVHGVCMDLLGHCILSTKITESSVIHPRETSRTGVRTLCLKPSAERSPKAKSERGLCKEVVDQLSRFKINIVTVHCETYDAIAVGTKLLTLLFEMWPWKTEQMSVAHTRKSCAVSSELTFGAGPPRGPQGCSDAGSSSTPAGTACTASCSLP